MTGSILWLLAFIGGFAAGFVCGWIVVLHLAAKSKPSRSHGTGHGEHPW